MTTTERAMIADELAKALGDLVDDCKGYPCSERPCYAYDKAIEALARYEASKQSEKPDTAQDAMPWLGALGALVCAAKDRDLSREDHERQINEAHSALFKLLRAAPAQPQAEVPGWAQEWRFGPTSDLCHVRVYPDGCIFQDDATLFTFPVMANGLAQDVAAQICDSHNKIGLSGKNG